jgi:hypothetical protein
LRRAERGHARGHHDPRHALGGRRLDGDARSHRVDPKDVLDRLRGHESGGVKSDLYAAHRAAHGRRIEDVGTHGLTFEAAEAPEARAVAKGDADVVPSLNQRARDVRAHEARRTGHTDLHELASPALR